MSSCTSAPMNPKRQSPYAMWSQQEAHALIRAKYLESACEQTGKTTDNSPTVCKPLFACLNHVLAEDVKARLNVPPYPASMMDGYAIHVQPESKHGQKKPRYDQERVVVGHFMAGTEHAVTAPGTSLDHYCAYVTTGGRVPAWANAVVKIEDTEGVGGSGNDGSNSSDTTTSTTSTTSTSTSTTSTSTSTTTTTSSPKDETTRNRDSILQPDQRVRMLVASTPGKFVRPAGADISRGQLLFQSGHIVTPADLGVLASQGLTSLRVRAPAFVHVCSTGDEIRDSLGGAGSQLVQQRVLRNGEAKRQSPNQLQGCANNVTSRHTTRGGAAKPVSTTPCAVSGPHSTATASPPGHSQDTLGDTLGIYDANRPALLGALTDGRTMAGCPLAGIVDEGVICDDRRSLTEFLAGFLGRAYSQQVPQGASGRSSSHQDGARVGGVRVLLMSGGVSMGARDFVKPVLKELGCEIVFGRVRVKPGKPLTFAVYRGPRSATSTNTNTTTDTQPKLPITHFIFGLPGNPCSALSCFYLFALPLLKMCAGWTGSGKVHLPRVSLQVTAPPSGPSARPEPSQPSPAQHACGCSHVRGKGKRRSKDAVWSKDAVRPEYVRVVVGGNGQGRHTLAGQTHPHTASASRRAGAHYGPSGANTTLGLVPSGAQTPHSFTQHGQLPPLTSQLHISHDTGVQRSSRLLSMSFCNALACVPRSSGQADTEVRAGEWVDCVLLDPMAVLNAQASDPATAPRATITSANHSSHNHGRATAHPSVTQTETQHSGSGAGPPGEHKTGTDQPSTLPCLHSAPAFTTPTSSDTASSNTSRIPSNPLRFGVLTVSTRVAKGQQQDKSGLKCLAELAQAFPEGGLECYACVSDDQDLVAAVLSSWADADLENESAVAKVVQRGVTQDGAASPSGTRQRTPGTEDDTRVQRQGADALNRSSCTDRSGVHRRMRPASLALPAPDESSKSWSSTLHTCEYAHTPVHPRRAPNIVFTLGGTGFSPKDQTPEATLRVLHRRAPGLEFLIAQTGLQHNAFAVLSRGVCGVRGGTVIVNFPGSSKAPGQLIPALAKLLRHAARLSRASN